MKPQTIWLPLACCLISVPALAVTPITNIPDFRQCLNDGWNVAHTISYGSTCQLQANPGVPYSVSTKLTILRSNITVEGQWISDRKDTTLQRAANITSIMETATGVTGVTIQKLAFDGNRYSAAIFPGWVVSGNVCPPSNISYYDLDLSTLAYSNPMGTFTLQDLDFLRSPGDSVFIDGYATTMSNSNIAYSDPTHATRTTGVRFRGNSSGLYYNYIRYAGTAGINITGTSQFVYGNQLFKNRYEISDFGGGGQIYTEPVQSSYASVAANILDGAFWQTDGTPVNGCATHAGTIERVSGVEGYSTGHRYYNNSIFNHTGSGMQFAGSEVTTGVTISGSNPWNPSDSAKYVDNNIGGIAFLGPNTNVAWIYPATNVTLDHIRVTDTHGFAGYSPYGVYLDSITGTGFINNACIYSTKPYYAGDISSPGASLTNPTPGSVSACP